MSWQIDFSKASLKFIDAGTIDEDKVISCIGQAIHKLQGHKVSIDLKKMKGEWAGFYRLRTGRIRILFSINFDKQQIYIDQIDFRANVYK